MVAHAAVFSYLNARSIINGPHGWEQRFDHAVYRDSKLPKTFCTGRFKVKYQIIYSDAQVLTPAPRFLTVPHPWQQHEHPNGDIYYHNPLLRLITPEDIRDPAMLECVLDARDDHIQCLQDDSSLDKLPDDWELTLTDVTDSAAVIGMHSRKLGLSYEWTEDTG
jgi:hypothetical protein